jgi:AcrR family transcriptional regulator
MTNNRKEDIIMATLELAAEKGLGNVSTSMIANKVGIKKPSLYNHFSSKDEIVEEMYQYLREKAKSWSNIGAVDYGALFSGKKAFDLLWMVVNNYKKVNQDEHMNMFYRVIYSERTRNPMAAKITAEETERMIITTKQLFYALQVHEVLHFQNPDMSAVTFAMTVHGLMDYEMDLQADGEEKGDHLMQEYLKWFCEENVATQELGGK